jgi:hypothetical protein
MQFLQLMEKQIQSQKMENKSGLYFEKSIALEKNMCTKIEVKTTILKQYR